MQNNILLIGGSLNQTTQMAQIANFLPEHNCYFTPFYADSLAGTLSRKGLLDFSILGGKHRRNTETFLDTHELPVDFGGQARAYDVVITCTDLIVPKNIRHNRLILVQEGITDPEGWMYKMVRKLRLPRYLANTAATGLSDAYDLFCVASKGYRDLFIAKGVRPEKIAVTGIPNFDYAESYLQNDFPYWDYTLVLTSCLRENFKPDNRPAFIRRALEIAAGRNLIFKLHPNEDFNRATAEIKRLAPEAIIFTNGNTNHMIANCAQLITQYTSAVYIGIALGKECYSYLDLDELRHLQPLQNRGRSAERIADLCRQLLRIPQDELIAARHGSFSKLRLKLPDVI